MNKLISVIVPVYNVEKYINRCVDSIRSQSYSNIEIILVDDGSTDGSSAICDEYKVLDARIKVIHKKNGGLSSARNTGIECANGEFFSFIDSDDYIESNMIEHMMQVARDYKADIVTIGRRNVYEDIDLEDTYEFVTDSIVVFDPQNAIKNILTRQNIDVSVCDKIFSKELFGEIRFPIGETNEDSAIIFNLIRKSSIVVHASGYGYNYVHREKSITTTFCLKNFQDLINHGRQMCDFISKEYPELKNYAILFQGENYIYIYYLLVGRVDSLDKKNMLDDARGYLKKHYRLISAEEKGVRKKLLLFFIKTNFYPFMRKIKRFMLGERNDWAKEIF